MPRRWTPQEECEKRAELHELYVKQNLTIREIGNKLGIHEVTVYDRLIRLGIEPTPEKKPGWIQWVGPRPINTPSLTEQLAEFCGIMLGDGHLSRGEIWVAVNNRDDKGYELFVSALIQELFHRCPGMIERKFQACTDLFISSVALIQFLHSVGLYASNKVKEQVDAPVWIFQKQEYIRGFLRGFFDTDGSVYRLRFGVQMSFTNRAMPLLRSLRRMSVELGFQPSEIRGPCFYLTRRRDLKRFYDEIGTHNPKHLKRFQEFGIPSFTLERTWKT